LLIHFNLNLNPSEFWFSPFAFLCAFA